MDPTIGLTSVDLSGEILSFTLESFSITLETLKDKPWRVLHLLSFIITCMMNPQQSETRLQFDQKTTSSLDKVVFSSVKKKR